MNELVTACKEGRTHVVHELLKKFDPSQRDNKGWTLLHYASEHGHKAIVELLLQRGCPSLAESRDKNTPLHLASMNGHDHVVCCLLNAMPTGVPFPKNKSGNNPLHLACKNGNASIVQVLREYSPTAAYDTNSSGVTPLGFALSNLRWEIASLLLEHTKGNPAHKFKDFTAGFPKFDPKRSLDLPVKIFVVGDHRSGKSTLIKSLQVEGLWDRVRGVSMNVPNVDQHRVGLVPNDFSGRRFGRVIFYDLASGPDFIHESLIESADDVRHSAFIICVNLKEGHREMESRILYWMTFIHHQCASYCGPKNKPNVTIVGTFSEIVKPFRLVNPHRLHLAYNSVIASHPEVSAQRLNLLRKYCILDCRKPQSPSMDALRSAVKRTCDRLRPKAVQIPSRCYILSSALATEIADTSESGIQLWELAARISSIASKDRKTLCKLLPQTVEELVPLCKQLQDSDRITVINPRVGDVQDVRSMWVIHRGHRLITMINLALEAANKNREVTSSPPFVDAGSLQLYFSSILNSDLLLQLLEHFKVCDSTIKVPNEDDQQLFYFPSLLPRDHPPQSWNPNDSSYSFQFAWALVPIPDQQCQFFMPRFLKLLLLSLLSAHTGYSCIGWSDGFYCHQDETEFCIILKSTAIILSMRCKDGNEIPCLQFRNQILKEIRTHIESSEPAIKIDECIISMEGKSFPLKTLKSNRKSFPISIMKQMKSASMVSPDPMIEKMLFIEPCFHLCTLRKPDRRMLSDPVNASKAVSIDFMDAVAKCFGNKWQTIVKHLDLASNVPTHSSESYSLASSASLEYGELLEQLSSVSIFEAGDMRRALQEAELSPDPPVIHPLSSTTTTKHSPQGSLSSNSASSLGTPTTEPHHRFLQTKQQSAGSKPSNLVSTSDSQQSIVSYGSSEKAYPASMRELQVIHRACAKEHNILCQLPCVDMIKVLQCDHMGGVYYSETHGFEINIPDGAVNDNIRLEFGVTLAGPFVFPKDMKPISVIIWLSIQERVPFDKSAAVTLPHFVNYTDDISQNVGFLAAEVKQGGKFHFQKIRKPGAGIVADSGTLRTRLSKHPCFVCIAAKSKDMASRTNYCLVEAIPKSIIQPVWKAHFCITYLLPTCIQIVTDQFKDEYSADILEAFTLECTGNPDPGIEIHFSSKEQGNWLLSGKRFRKIRPHQVEFSSVDQAQLRTKTQLHLYPPRFTIEVNGARADNDAFADISFSGMKGGPMPVQLLLPKCDDSIGTRRASLITRQRMPKRTQSVTSFGSVGSRASVASLLSLPPVHPGDESIRIKRASLNTCQRIPKRTQSVTSFGSVGSRVSVASHLSLPPAPQGLAFPSSEDRTAEMEQNRRFLASLECDQVLQLLDVIGLPQYKEIFNEEHISGKILVECDDEILKEELNITSGLDRIRLTNIITGKTSIQELWKDSY